MPFGAAISRRSARLHAYIGQKLYEWQRQPTEQLPVVERTGGIPPLVPTGRARYGPLGFEPRALEAMPKLLGVSPHLLRVAWA